MGSEKAARLRITRGKAALRLRFAAHTQRRTAFARTAPAAMPPRIYAAVEPRQIREKMKNARNASPTSEAYSRLIFCRPYAVPFRICASRTISAMQTSAPMTNAAEKAVLPEGA